MPERVEYYGASVRLGLEEVVLLAPGNLGLVVARCLNPRLAGCVEVGPDHVCGVVATRHLQGRGVGRLETQDASQHRSQFRWQRLDRRLAVFRRRGRQCCRRRIGIKVEVPNAQCRQLGQSESRAQCRRIQNRSRRPVHAEANGTALGDFDHGTLFVRRERPPCRVVGYFDVLSPGERIVAEHPFPQRPAAKRMHRLRVAVARTLTDPTLAVDLAIAHLCQRRLDLATRNVGQPSEICEVTELFHTGALLGSLSLGSALRPQRRGPFTEQIVKRLTRRGSVSTDQVPTSQSIPYPLGQPRDPFRQRRIDQSPVGLNVCDELHKPPPGLR